MDSTAVARRLDLIDGSSSPLWYRGWVESDSLSNVLGRIREHYDARIHVVGHTPVPTVTQRYRGRMIAVDMQRPATELLLLIPGERGRLERWGVRQDGPPIPLASGDTILSSEADGGE